MGNKHGKLSYSNPCYEEDLQRLLKSNDDEDNSYDTLGVLPDAGEDIPSENLVDESNAVEDRPLENLTESPKLDNGVPVAILVDLSDDVEGGPSENLAESSNVEEDVSGENLVDVSDVESDVEEAMPLGNLRDVSNAVERGLTKTSAIDVYNMNETSLDAIIKISDFLKNLSLENSSVENLMRSLTAGQHIPSGNADPSEQIFRLRVFIRDCFLYHAMGLKCTGKLKCYECFGCIRGNDSTTCLIHISNYNKERKKVLDCTIIDSRFNSGLTKFVLYLWDSEEEAWRLITPGSDEMDLGKYYIEAEVWAQTINYRQRNKETIKDVSKSTLAAQLPPHILESLEGETNITTYDYQLDKVIDLSLARGKTYNGRTEFYIEWRGLRNFAYSFTARNDDTPSAQ